MEPLIIPTSLISILPSPWTITVTSQTKETKPMNITFKCNTFTYSCYFTYKFPRPSFQLETKIHLLHRFNTCIYMRLEWNGCLFSNCIWKYFSWNGIWWHFESNFTGFFSGDSISRGSSLWHVKICQRASDEPIFEQSRWRLPYMRHQDPIYCTPWSIWFDTVAAHTFVLRNSLRNDVLRQYWENLTSNVYFA